MKIFSSPQAGAHIVATVIVVGFVMLVAFLAIHQVEPSKLLERASDILGTCFTYVVSYYMGSSMSSAQKTAQISHLIGQSPQTSQASEPAQPEA